MGQQLPYGPRPSRKTSPPAVTLADLPAAHDRHWSARKKAIVVAAVSGGLLTLQDAHERYELSTEEYISWTSLFDGPDYAGLAQRKQKARTDLDLSFRKN
jgi:hypothetical protein